MVFKGQLAAVGILRATENPFYPTLYVSTEKTVDDLSYILPRLNELRALIYVSDLLFRFTSPDVIGSFLFVVVVGSKRFSHHHFCS